MQWVANRAEGLGKFLHSDGDFYIGEWSGNMANGIGKYYHKGSTTYAGQWKKDMQDGYGIETWIEGAQYQGSFQDGQKQGHGIYSWTDGSVYEGRKLPAMFGGKDPGFPGKPMFPRNNPFLDDHHLFLCLKMGFGIYHYGNGSS
eukprot:s3236_g8.t1